MKEILSGSVYGIHPFLLACAFLIDLAIGDPAWLPHPVRIMGAGIEKTETLLRRLSGSQAWERASGVLLVIFMGSSVYFATAVITSLAGRVTGDVRPFAAILFLALLASTVLASRGLIEASMRVVSEVKSGDIENARRSLGMIVGRDTAGLSEEKIVKAVIETLAENLSDGVIAPLFYLSLGGIPLAMAYKAVNTMDSMVGYKNDRYMRFGWAAARLDDAANYIPARITGFVIALAAVFAGSFPRALLVMLRDGKNHSSPNSGVPEAAMAGALGIRLGGPSFYGGRLVEKPCIGDEEKPLGKEELLEAARKALLITGAGSAIGAAVSVAAVYFLR